MCVYIKLSRRRKNVKKFLCETDLVFSLRFISCLFIVCINTGRDLLTPYLM